MAEADGSGDALVTGATGLVGGAITLRLLDRTQADVWCLVRDRARTAAAERLTRTLSEAAVLYGRPDLRAEIQRRCHPLTGDITEPGCGVPDARLPTGIAELWHCAASLKHQDSAAAQIRHHNVTGTRNVVALAGRLGVTAFNHVSTAYVAGRNTGLIPEEPVAVDTEPNNAYERTKMEAETVVAALEAPTVRILRPTIVIGHRRTLGAATYSGMYGFIDQLLLFAAKTRERLGDYLDHYRVAVLADPGLGANLIPVDAVAAAAVGLLECRAPTGIYHLANLRPTRLEDVIGGIFDAVGVRQPRYTTDPTGLTSLDQRLNDGLDFHRAYCLQDKVFDCSRAVKYGGADALEAPLTRDDVRAFAEYYIRTQPRARRLGRVAVAKGA